MPLDKLGIVADDLTGAMDSSGYFAAHGWKTIVVLNEGFSANADVLVLNTDSRADVPEVAAAKVHQAVKRLDGRAIFKKIDSTLRGNIAVELDAALTGSGDEKAIICPSFPAMGRTVVDGILLVNGVPVSETQFARDPVSPVMESHIPTLLRKSSPSTVGCVVLSDMATGALSLYQKIMEMSQDVIVCDAATQSHLACIADAADLAGGSWLLCGSSGLAREIRLAPQSAPEVETERSAPQGDVLVVVGSRNERSAAQLLMATERLNLPILNMDTIGLGVAGSPAMVRRMAAEANILLREGKGIAISAISSEYDPLLKDVIPKMMADLAADILGLGNFAGVFLSGGDIAGAVCRRLSVSAIEVLCEVEPGIPAGELSGGPWQGMRVVTKAGGFGTPEALLRSIAYLKKGRSS